MVEDVIREVLRNPFWLFSKQQTRGEQAQKQGVQLGASVMIQMRYDDGLLKGGGPGISGGLSKWKFGTTTRKKCLRNRFGKGKSRILFPRC